ncbi:MAG: hypothetical protein HZA80_01350 [Candidatus Taylorbacteria bacterium]|nr:hypothetical protein [Candidatus Taylorbacteria bacterium]
MMLVTTFGDALNRALVGMLYGVASFLPVLLFAAVIFILGWVVAALVEKLIEAVFRSAKVDSLFRAAGFEEALKRGGYNLNTGRFLGTLVKWFIVVIFLVAVCDALGLVQVNEFLIVVLGYLPRIIVSVVVLGVAAILGGAAQKFVTASARAGHIGSANFLGAVAKWAIWIFAVLTALDYLNIAGQFLQILYTGIVVAIALALGLSFGLGGRDAAAGVIAKLTHDASDRN